MKKTKGYTTNRKNASIHIPLYSISLYLNSNLIFTVILLILFVFEPCIINAQRYSMDKPIKHKIHINIHFKTLFKADPQKKAERKKKSESRKASRNEIKTEKKYWKHHDKPKDISTNRKIVRRMKKNLRIAERHNHNKFTETKIKRLSRKKIKLPKISTTKIHWPWTKKQPEE